MGHAVCGYRGGAGGFFFFFFFLTRSQIFAPNRHMVGYTLKFLRRHMFFIYTNVIYFKN